MRLLTAALIVLIPSSSFGITCKEVVELVKERSLQVKASRESVKREEYNQEATRRELFPKVNLSGSFQEVYPDLFGNWNQNYSLSVSLNAQPVNFQTYTQIKISSLKVKESKALLKETLLEEIYQALSQLYTLKAYEERIRLKEASLKDAEEIYKVAMKKYKEGLVMITDVLKAKSDAEKVKGELASLKGEYLKSFNLLNQLLDFSLKEGEKPEVKLKKKKLKINKEELLKEALSLRPQVKASRERVAESSLQVKLTKESLSPTLNLSLSASREGSSFLPSQKNYSFGFTLNFPVFDSGLTKYRTLSAQKGKEIEEINLKKTENQVKREVLDAIVQVKVSYENLKSAASFLEFAEKAYERSFNEYKLGVSDIVSLLQARETLNQARDEYTSALLNYNLAILGLKRATGELLKEVEN